MLRITPLSLSLDYAIYSPEAFCRIEEGKSIRYIYFCISNPITGLWGPEDSGRLRLPDSVISALEGGRLSAIRTGRLYPQDYPGTHF
jgi:hypothetical protein